jgi:UPF0755 protein
MLLFALLISCGFVAQQMGTPADLAATTPIEFTVPAGSTARRLGPLLATAGVVNDADSFKLYVRLTGEGSCLKAGRHKLSRSMSAGEIITTLCGAPLGDDEPFTVIEGWRIREIDAALAAKGWAQPGAYKKLAGDPSRFNAPFALPKNSLEGYLFPDTYMIDTDKFTVAGFIQRQLDTFAERFWRSHQDKLGKRSLAHVVIMASMIVREEPKPKNRRMVSGILWKRIDHKWNLGVDATSRYTLTKWNDRRAFLKKLRDPKDPYNTRLRQGLPPTPIGNPDVSSLAAAADPEASEFWYYLHDHKQVLRPSKSAQGHEAKRRKYNVY